MLRVILRTMIVCIAASASSGLALGDVILTADGETISGHESIVVDGVFQVPGESGAEPRKWNLVNLQRVSFAPSRPTGELKTRFVRIELPGDQKMLHMAEVQVFEGEENIAVKGKATQSSLYQNMNEAAWGPQKAIDGNTDGNSRTAGTTHTNMESNPWWEVDLGRDAKVKKVVVWNRTDDNVGPRIAGFRVVLLDEKRTPLWSRTFPDPPNPSVEMMVPERGDAFTEADVKAFDDYSGRTATGSVLNSLVGWLSGKPAAAPQPAAPGQAVPNPAAAPAAQPAPDIPDGARVFQLAYGARITGKLQKWTEQGATIEFTAGGQTVTQTIPTEFIREVLSKESVAQPATLDRSQISSEADTVFAKVEGGGVQAVTGTVKGVDGDALQFEFQGKVRKISMNRVMDVVRHAVDPTRSDPFALVELRGNQRLPGRIVSLANGKSTVESLWGERFELPRPALIEMVVRNGRVTSLTELEPIAAEQIPYLDRKIPHSVNRSLSGSPLQIGETKFDRGLCTHSRSLLQYDLNPGYSRFRSKIGLQQGDGDQGNAVVRVAVDGGVIYEKAVVGAHAAEEIDVDVSGKKTLTLEVDYGEDVDIGDHVVWGDPVLVRPVQ